MAKESEPHDLEAAKTVINRRDCFKLIPSALLGAIGGTLLADSNPLRRINIWERPLPKADPDAYKFLIIADIHAGNFDNGVRQNNTESLNTLKDVLKHLEDYPFDRVIQMGDLIRQLEGEGQNITNYEKGLHILEQFPCPVTHLLGNHDIWGISPESFLEIYKERNLNPFFGVEKYNNFQIVWLDMSASPSKPGTLPEERIDWLKNKIIFKDTPTIIFSHYALLPQDADGNYYFGGSPGLTAFTNGPRVWESLRGLPVHAIVSAHMHWGAYSRVDKTHMITVPAFVENMVSSNSDENPGVYSILEVNYPEKFVLKSYFGSICISRIQI